MRNTLYQHLYWQVHILNPCVGCGANRKLDRVRTQGTVLILCISQFDVELIPTDTISKACYDMHSVIQQNIQILTIPPSAQLQSDLASWTTRISGETTDELTRSVLTTAIFVGKSPQAVTVFNEKYHQGNESEELCLELKDGSVTFSARGLMNQLITHLELYMSYKCIVIRFGTLLYSRNGDTLKVYPWHCTSHM